ncbi:MAG TPA: glutathione S-transferase family protein [Geminicoccaceae bacterium]|nr:glutathione S-transferase family protein [Geminicoccaceae bacterium]
MAKPVIYGPAYSTYARTCRLALEEKGVEYDLVGVDIFSGEHRGPAHLARHPFGKVPAFAHDGLELYETDAITRYVDEAFPGPALQPADPAGRARMTQAINVIGNYAYPAMIGQIFVQRAVVPMRGGTADEAAIAAAVPQAETAVAALEKLIDGNSYLAGDRLSLADLLLIPVYDYFSQIPDGQKILARAPNLQRWWESVRSRPSVEKTRPSLG